MNHLSQIINRNRSQKGLAVLNVVGLSVCIGVAMLILFYVRFELNFDRFHHDADRIYRAESRLYEREVLTDRWATTTFGHGPVMKRSIPGIEQYVRVTAQDREQEVSYGDRQFIEERYCYTEPAFFKLFNISIAEGNVQTQLVRPNTAVIARSAANRYFGSDSPIGKILTFKTPTAEQHFEVTGVMDDMPQNSHLRYDFLLSYSTIPEVRQDIWYIHGVYTYLLLDRNTTPKEVETAFHEISDRYRTQALSHKDWQVELVPLKDIHLTPRKPYEKEAKGSRIAVDILLIMAIALLLTGWVNALNLAAARYLEQGREFGLRKIFGASSSHIITYALLESAMVNLLAMLLSAVWLVILYPLVARLVGSNFASDILTSPEGWAIIISVYIIGVLLIGIYPSLLLTRIKPSDVIRGKMLHSRKGNNTRKLLILLQFVASFILVSGTIIVGMQVDYMQRASSNTLLERIVVIKYPSATDNMTERITGFKKRLEQLPEVNNVAVSSAVLGTEVANYFTNRPYGSDLYSTKLIQMLAVDHDYFAIYKPRFVCGRGFSENYGNEQNKVVLNESAVRTLGFESNEDALGKQLDMEVVKTPLEIIGIVSDYQQQSLAEPYKPIIFFMKERVPIIATPYISVLLNSAAEPEFIAEIERIYKSCFPLAAFSYFRLNDFNYALYKTDRNFSVLFTFASLIAIFVACLGLWTITLFSTRTRLKEVGIRKVLGAGKTALFMVLIKELAVITVAAAAIGTPVSMIIMNEWLKSYAFHITPPWWIYLAALAMIAGIGLLTIVRQIRLVIHTNPIDILRNE